MKWRFGMQHVKLGRPVAALLACAVVSAVSANAENNTRVYEISGSPAHYLQTRLSHDIHRYADSAQLSDVVVIDKLGNELPFRITETAGQVSDTSQRFPLNFFPVSGEAAPETWRSQGKTLVRVNESSVSIVLDQNEPAAPESQAAPVDFYLLDLSQSEIAVDSLTLDWEVEEASQYLEVQVSASSDLQNWSNLGKETLVQLQKEGETLVRNRLPLRLPAGQYDYLRIKFLRDGDAIELKDIYGHTSIQSYEPVPRDSWQVHGELAESQTSVSRIARNAEPAPVAAWEYRRQENAPVTWVNIDIGQIAYGDSLRLFSRAKETQAWRPVHRGIWFNAQIGGDWQHSETMSIYANSDAYWRLELDKTIRGKAAPSLILEHPLKTLQFIANNNPPYYIATSGDKSHASPAAQVFSRLLGDEPVQWVDVDTSPLNPTIHPSAAESTAVNWAGIAFWALLLAAVAVLMGFALRLYKQMDQSS